MHNSKSIQQSDFGNVNQNTKDSFIRNGRSVPFGNGVKWASQGIDLFFQQPKKWAVALMILIVLEYVFNILPEQFFSQSSFMPTILGLLKLFIDTLLFASVIAVAESQRLTGKADLRLIGAGLGKNMGAIIALVAIMLLILIIGIVVPMIVISISTSTPTLPDPKQIAYIIQTQNYDFIFNAIESINIVAIIFILIIGLGCPIITMMMSSFAVHLIIFKQFPLFLALTTSLKACLKNILPVIAYLIAIAFILFIVGLATTPLTAFFDIDWLMITITLFPISWLASYASYRNIFSHSESIID